MIDVKRRDYEQARSVLRRSYRKDSSNTRTTLYLGVSYLNLDSLQRASTYLQRTIDRKAQGSITEALIQKGNVNDQRGDVSGAVRSCKMDLRLRPDRTDVYFYLANLYDEYYREKKTAARYYRRFLRASDSTRESLRISARDRLEALRSTGPAYLPTVFPKSEGEGRGAFVLGPAPRDCWSERRIPHRSVR